MYNKRWRKRLKIGLSADAFLSKSSLLVKCMKRFAVVAGLVAAVLCVTNSITDSVMKKNVKPVIAKSFQPETSENTQSVTRVSFRINPVVKMPENQ